MEEGVGEETQTIRDDLQELWGEERLEGYEMPQMSRTQFEGEEQGVCQSLNGVEMMFI